MRTPKVFHNPMGVKPRSCSRPARSWALDFDAFGIRMPMHLSCLFATMFVPNSNIDFEARNGSSGSTIAA